MANELQQFSRTFVWVASKHILMKYYYLFESGDRLGLQYSAEPSQGPTSDPEIQDFSVEVASQEPRETQTLCTMRISPGRHCC